MIDQNILQKRVSDDRRFAARLPSVKFSIDASRDGAAKSAYVFRPPAELGSLKCALRPVCRIRLGRRIHGFMLTITVSVFRSKIWTC